MIFFPGRKTGGPTTGLLRKGRTVAADAARLTTRTRTEALEEEAKEKQQIRKKDCGGKKKQGRITRWGRGTSRSRTRRRRGEQERVCRVEKRAWGCQGISAAAAAAAAAARTHTLTHMIPLLLLRRRRPKTKTGKSGRHQSCLGKERGRRVDSSSSSGQEEKRGCRCIPQLGLRGEKGGNCEQGKVR